MKFIATKEWQWHLGTVTVSVKPGDAIPDELPKELIQTLLDMDNIMPATTASKPTTDE